MFIETSFHLLFPPDIPLIPLFDMFVEQNDSLFGYQFTINLLMEIGETDLKTIIEGET